MANLNMNKAVIPVGKQRKKIVFSYTKSESTALRKKAFELIELAMRAQAQFLETDIGKLLQCTRQVNIVEESVVCDYLFNSSAQRRDSIVLRKPKKGRKRFEELRRLNRSANRAILQFFWIPLMLV